MAPGPTRDSRSAAETVGTAAADKAAGLACTIKGLCPFRLLVFLAVIVLFALTATLNARGADAGSGKRLAQDRCAACHSVTPHARSEVAAAPPFDVIGRKYGFDADRIAHAIAGPHPKMNFAPGPREAADIAAYIAGLRQ
jgi:cytochrome c